MEIIMKKKQQARNRAIISWKDLCLYYVLYKETGSTNWRLCDEVHLDEGSREV